VVALLPQAVYQDSDPEFDKTPALPVLHLIIGLFFIVTGILMMLAVLQE
jgi:hypothetical protein